MKSFCFNQSCRKIKNEFGGVNGIDFKKLKGNKDKPKTKKKKRKKNKKKLCYYRQSELRKIIRGSQFYLELTLY